nr:twin-arginine translocase subunit TatC [Halonotius roseus]
MAKPPDGGDNPADRDEPPTAGGEPSAADTATPPDVTADGGTGSSVAADQPAAPAGDSVEEGLAGEGPATDEEMPLADHIEEMMRRLGVVFLIAGIALAVTYPFAGDLVNYLWSVHIPEPVANRPRLYGPLEFILTKLKVAGLAGLVIGLPMFVYQTYRFMRPGLYPTERRYYLAAVPTSLVLGTFGVLFAHFAVLPFVFAYFTTYTAEAAAVAFGLQETFNLILVLMGWMAIIFQIPLFIMLAIMMNLVTRQWLEAKRLIFWGSFLGIAFLFSPDPTGMAPIIVALTMVVLFEGTLALLRWTGN